MMGQDERILKAILEFGLDEASAKKLKAGIDSATKGLKDAEAQAKKTQQALENMRKAAESMQRVGMVLAAGGAAIGAPLLAFANQYVQAAGKAEATSRNWQKAMTDMQRSEMRVGRVVAEQALPYLEKVAALADKLATWAEQNPQIIEAALKIAGSAVVAGTGLSLAGGAIRTAADLSTLARIPGVGGALGKAGGAMAGLATGPVGITLGAAALGGAIGLGGYNLIGGGVANLTGHGDEWQNKNIGDIGRTAFQAAQIPMLLGVTALRDLGIISQDTARQVAQFAQGVADTGKAAEQAAAQTKPGNALDNSPAKDQLIQSYIGYQKQMSQTQKQYESQRTQIINDYGKQRVDLEKSYESQRSKAVSDWSTSNSNAWDEYYKQLSQKVRDFRQQQAQEEANYKSSVLKNRRDLAVTLTQMDQDYARNVEQIERDHNGRVGDLAAANDALGLGQEQRRYEQEKKDAEEQHKTERQRTVDESAQSLSDLTANFQEQKKIREIAFDQQLADERDAFTTAQQKRYAEHVKQLAEMEKERQERQKELDAKQEDALKQLTTTYDATVDALRQSFIDRIRGLDDQILGDYELYVGYLEDQGQAFANWISQAKGTLSGGLGGSTGGGGGKKRASGGYASYGDYTLGEKGIEWVMNADTTKQAENLLGTSLTQENLLGALVRGPGGRGGQTINVTLELGSGSISLSERRQLLRESRESALSALSGALEMMAA